ncbi:hypothetical protein L1887_11814 [Cichorium endivia]|nr:hypothetical protein L1887_11814 [Cichorium endivia]
MWAIASKTWASYGLPDVGLCYQGNRLDEEAGLLFDNASKIKLRDASIRGTQHVPEWIAILRETLKVD